jgi:hypothetical protein
MIFFATTLLITVLHALLDAIKIKRHEYIDHFWRSIVWFFVSLIPMIIIEANTSPGWYYPFTSVIVMLTIRVGFYDFFLNKFRGLSLWYTSTKSGSWWDNFYIKYGINQNAVRVSFFIFSLIHLTLLIIYKIY